MNFAKCCNGSVGVEAFRRDGAADGTFFLGTIDERFGVYVQDQIEFSEQWHLLLGARYDHAVFEQSFNQSRKTEIKVKDDEINPRIGLLFQPRP